MATTTYLSLTSKVSQVTNTCPSLTAAEAIKETVIDLCERGQVWKYKHADVTLVAGTYNYAFIPPNADTVVSLVESARINDLPISIVTPIDGIANFPTFPDLLNPGPPMCLFQMDQRFYNITPTPDAAITYTLKLMTTLKPTQASTGADSVVIAEHQETIVHGALHRLLMQPKRDWSNTQLGEFHGKQYTYKLNMFKAQAVKGFGRVNISVQMRPFA